MSDQLLIPDAQAKSLIDEINARTQRQSDDVLSESRTEAATIIKTAHRDARARLHNVVRRLRKSRETSLSREKARLELERILHHQKEDAQLLARGMPLVENAMRRRWEDSSARQIWIIHALEIALTFLAAGNWQIYLPPTIHEDEFSRICSGVDIVDSITLDLVSDREIKTVLRIEMDDAVVDATLEGLLADTETIKAMLLAEIGSMNSVYGRNESNSTGGAA